MAEFPAMPLWTDAYIGDTTHLSMLESGCYLQILMVSWRRADCAVDDDDKKLARICRMRLDQWAKVRPVLEPFFTIKDGLWCQKRLQKESKFLLARRSKKVQAANVRWLKEKETNDARAYPSDMHVQCTHTHTQESKKERSSNEDAKKENASPSAQPIAKHGQQDFAERKVANHASRGCRIPDGWKPTSNDVAYAISQGCTEIEIEQIALDFYQYWVAKSGQDAVKMDWHATWQRWIRVDRDGTFKRNRNGNGKHTYISPKARLVEQWLAESSDVDNSCTCRGDGIDTSSAIMLVQRGPISLFGPNVESKSTKRST